MSDSTEVQVSSQPSAQTFSFEGHDVRVITRDGAPWFVATDLCKALQLTNSRVALKALAEDEKGVSSTYTPGGEQSVAVVSEGGMWTLVLRCRDAVTEGTVPYRVRRWVTHEVLPAIRQTGVYVGKPFVVNPGDVLTQEEQNTLRLMLKTAVERLPKEKQAGAMVKGWSKLKSHFGVPYRQIPRAEFSEAVSIVARHTAEWELVDDPARGKYTYPLADARPHDHGFFANSCLTPRRLLDKRNRALELELLEQLKADGHDVEGVRVRILAMREALRAFEEQRVHVLGDWKVSLKRLLEYVETYREERGLPIIFTRTPNPADSFDRVAFPEQLGLPEPKGPVYLGVAR